MSKLNMFRWQLRTLALGINVLKQILPGLCRNHTILSSTRNAAGSQRVHTVHRVRHASQKKKLVAPVFLRAYTFKDKVAVIDQHGSHTYAKILYQAHNVSDKLLTVGRFPNDLPLSRVCFACPNNVSYVVAQWATWMSGGVAVPLCAAHPPSEMKYFIQDSDCDVIISTEDLVPKLEETAMELKKTLVVLKREKEFYVPEIANQPGPAIAAPEASQRQRRWNHMLHVNQFRNLPAMMLYTSGTTGRPKGVVHTFSSLDAQVDAMTQAWEWMPDDVILHTLPLHHTHGVVNALMTPLYHGATCLMLPKFDPKEVWSALMQKVTLFMAVPTIYAKLLEYFDAHYGSDEMNHAHGFLHSACKDKIRLMVSGSAALPEPIMRRWEEVTGHALLERYGMTELGMVLTNPLRGDRVAGSVGVPFPNVEVAIGKPSSETRNKYDIIAQGDQHKTTVKPGQEDESGELLVRGPNVFQMYWRRPDATREAFTPDDKKWFRTGDTACYKDGTYRILGRTSVDIIKSGGYKISALDIETHLLSHDEVMEAVVVGLPDLTFGQKIAAVVKLKEESEVTVDELRAWCLDRIPKYQIPRVWKLVESVPRNAMGKVNKKQLVQLLFPDEVDSSG